MKVTRFFLALSVASLALAAKGYAGSMGGPQEGRGAHCSGAVRGPLFVRPLSAAYSTFGIPRTTGEVSYVQVPSTFPRSAVCMPPVPPNVTIQVQRMLRHCGLYAGPLDGQVGYETHAAIRAFQAQRGLPVNGDINSTLIISLNML